jgi:hypothetical protein
MADGPGVQRAAGLLDGAAGLRVQAAERHEPPARVGGRLDDVVVGRRVAVVGLVHGEHDAARVHRLEHADQVARVLLEAVGIVEADVRMGVVERQISDLGDQRVVVGPQQGFDVEHWTVTLQRTGVCVRYWPNALPPPARPNRDRPSCDRGHAAAAPARGIARG